MKIKKIIYQFRKGDWILTNQLPCRTGQKYTNAHIIKVKNKGALLDVQYGSWMTVATIESKYCELLKRDTR